MDFVSILPNIIAGDSVRRNLWKHDNRFITLVSTPTGGTPPVDAKKVLVNYSEGQVANYAISSEDFNATDWEAL